MAPQYALFVKRLTRRNLSQNLQVEKNLPLKICRLSSNNQLLAKFQEVWDNDSDSNIVYYHRNCNREIFNAAITSSRKRTSEASREREESRKKKQRLCTVGDSKVSP